MLLGYKEFKDSRSGFQGLFVNDFLRVIEVTEPRFINQVELLNKIQRSKDVAILANYAKAVKKLFAANQIDDSHAFLLSKEVDNVPLIWFQGSEKVLKENKGILNVHTVTRLALDAYRQYQLDNA